MDPQELALRDIHLPAEPGWWPPAPGWWILAVLLAIAAIAAWNFRRRPRPVTPLLDLALRELGELRVASDAPIEQVRLASALLRRVAIARFPRTETAALTGEGWLRFLDQPLVDRPFSSGAGRMLIDAPYRPEVRADQVAPLLELCGRWIESLRASGAQVCPPRLSWKGVRRMG